MSPFRQVILTKQTRIAGLTPEGTLLINPITYPQLPLPARIFILFHEYAHKLGIRVEQEADLFAVEGMKVVGYGDKDIALAHALTLSGGYDNDARVSAVIDYLRRRS